MEKAYSNPKVRLAKLLLFIPVLILAAEISYELISRAAEQSCENDNTSGIVFIVSYFAVCISCIVCSLISKHLTKYYEAPSWMGLMAGIEAVLGVLLFIPAFAFLALTLRF